MRRRRRAFVQKAVALPVRDEASVHPVAVLTRISVYSDCSVWRIARLMRPGMDLPTGRAARAPSMNGATSASVGSLPSCVPSSAGVYCLRANVRDWDEETLWRTYSTLTDVEAVFRSLKSDLGLRPIFHQTAKHSDGHSFISVIAYRLVQTIRRRLGEQSERQSWSGLRRILEGQLRVTRPSGERTDAPCMSARPPAPIPISTPSIRHWAQPALEASGRGSSNATTASQKHRNVVPHARNMDCNALIINNRL